MDKIITYELVLYYDMPCYNNYGTQIAPFTTENITYDNMELDDVIQIGKEYKAKNVYMYEIFAHVTYVSKKKDIPNTRTKINMVRNVNFEPVNSGFAKR